MSEAKNVAIAGAAGSLGSVMLERLLASGKFNVRVLRRLGSTSAIPAGVEVVEVDYDSVDALKAALQDQDAIICTTPSHAIGSQRTIIDAAVAAGVKRFIPSEFGSDLDNPRTRKLPVFAEMVLVLDYLIYKGRSAGITYTFVYNSGFLDWGLEKDFILRISDGKPILIDGGDYPFSTTTLASVGDAVVVVLTHLEETRNRAVYIHDLVTTQNRLLTLAKEIAPNKEWAPVQVKLDDLTAAADARLAKGLFDMETFAPYLFRAVLDPGFGGRFQKTDNDLLGIKGKTDDDIKAILKSLLK